MAEGQEARTPDDLERAVRALATHFGCDTTIVVGSQATLVGWPDAPILMRTSPEIDAYPINAREWEEEHGFHIDGVDEDTAKLPPGWKSRCVERQIEHGGVTLRAIAPCMTDLIVSKLLALREKDKDFIREYHRARHLDRGYVKRILTGMLVPPAQFIPRFAAGDHASSLSQSKLDIERVGSPCPMRPGTHAPGLRTQANIA